MIPGASLYNTYRQVYKLQSGYRGFHPPTLDAPHLLHSGQESTTQLQIDGGMRRGECVALLHWHDLVLRGIQSVPDSDLCTYLVLATRCTGNIEFY